MSKYLSSKEVAAKYGVNQASVCRWIKSKKLGALKVGRDYLISEEDIQTFEKVYRIYPEMREIQ